MIRTALALAVALTASIAAPASGDGFATGSCSPVEGSVLPGDGAIRRVPADYPSIQAAVDAASRGDTILVSPGTYTEAVVVATPDLRIRGTDRNQVVLDGRSELGIGFDVTADRVLVENLTVHNYTRYAVLWDDVAGYWGRYITAYDLGQYGLYAFDARCGQIDHTYASGSTDSGYYIGQCYPCDAVITDIVAEENALGYSGTNAGGNLTLRDSVWRNNALGIVPNSGDGEGHPPQRGATIENNLVVANMDTRRVPGSGTAGLFFGVGIVIAGGSSNHVAGNTVLDQELAGIMIVELPGPTPWIPAGNVVWRNTVSGPDGSMDLLQSAGSGPNNCWTLNTFATTAPPMLEDVWSCGLPQTPPGGDLRGDSLLVAGLAEVNGRDPSPWQTYPVPDGGLSQPSLADPACDVDGDCALEGWLPALGL